MYLQDGSVPDALGLVSPAFLGMRVPLERAAGAGTEVEAVTLDVSSEADDLATVLEEQMGEGVVVAAVIAPFTRLSPPMAEALRRAGLPALSLSGLQQPVRGFAAWRSLVPPPSAQADVIRRFGSAAAPPGRICLAGDASAQSSGLSASLAPATWGRSRPRDMGSASGPADLARLIERIGVRGCRVVVWTGFAEGAAALRRGLSWSVALIGSDAIRADRFPLEAGPRAELTTATCGCLDLSLSTQPRAQRFVNAYQSSTGLVPGPYAVEGNDAGLLLLRAIGAKAAPTAETVAAALRRTERFRGIGSYGFDRRGRLVDPEGHVRAAQVRAGRWLPALVASP